MKPPRPLTFFIDRCIGKQVMQRIPHYLKTGERAEHLEAHYPQDVQDEVWIPEVGAKGWVIITKDSRIQYRDNERVALASAATAAFILTNGNLKSDAVVNAVITALPRMREAIRTCDVPLLARFNAAGEVTVFVESGTRLSPTKTITRTT